MSDVHLTQPTRGIVAVPPAVDHAAAAADLIRSHWGKHAEGMPPEEQHRVRFLLAVCYNLHVEPTPINVAHAAFLLEKAGFELPTGDEYPKALYVRDPQTGKQVEAKYPDGDERAGLPVVFANEDEEKAWGAGKPAGSGESGSESQAWWKNEDAGKAAVLTPVGGPKPAVPANISQPPANNPQEANRPPATPYPTEKQ